MRAMRLERCPGRGHRNRLRGARWSRRTRSPRRRPVPRKPCPPSAVRHPVSLRRRLPRRRCEGCRPIRSRPLRGPVGSRCRGSTRSGRGRGGGRFVGSARGALRSRNGGGAGLQDAPGEADRPGGPYGPFLFGGGWSAGRWCAMRVRSWPLGSRFRPSRARSSPRSRPVAWRSPSWRGVVESRPRHTGRDGREAAGACHGYRGQGCARECEHRAGFLRRGVPPDGDICGLHPMRGAVAREVTGGPLGELTDDSLPRRARIRDLADPRRPPSLPQPDEAHAPGTRVLLRRGRSASPGAARGARPTCA